MTVNNKINEKIDDYYEVCTIQEIAEERFTSLEYILKRLVETGKITQDYASNYLYNYNLNLIKKREK